MTRQHVNSRPEHREAVLLSWKSLHIPFGAILLTAIFAACVLSTLFSILADVSGKAFQ
jgi:hypothetical protein